MELGACKWLGHSPAWLIDGAFLSNPIHRSTIAWLFGASSTGPFSGLTMSVSALAGYGYLGRCLAMLGTWAGLPQPSRLGISWHPRRPRTSTRACVWLSLNGRVPGEHSTSTGNTCGGEREQPISVKAWPIILFTKVLDLGRAPGRVR